MRRTWIALLLSALVTVTPSRATDGPDKEAAAKEAPAQTAAKKKPATAAKKPAQKSVTEALSAEVEQLRQMMMQQSQQMEAQQKMMREQQERLNALTEELRSAQAAASSAAATAQEAKAEQGNAKVTEGQLEAVADATNDLTKKVAALDKDYQGEKKSLGDKIKAIGPFSFSGDFRLRDEPFIGGPTNQSQVRNRARFRARLNINAKFNDDISGGLSVASGDLNDPISTNQTLNQFYTRKPFALDRAFITYTPHQFKALALTGGKFAYPWYRTELTWDNDLNPEGVAQTLQWNFTNKTPVIRRFALVGFELPFTEVQRTGANQSRIQSAVYGGQVQAVWELANWLRLSTYGGYYNYHNPDAIAFGLAAAGGNPQTPLNGLLPIGGASVQNVIYRTTRQTFLTTDALGNPLPAPLATGSPTIVNAQFASKFGLLDAIARFDIKTSMPRLPIVILGDYVQNTRACANLENVPALCSTPSPIVVTTTSVTTVTRSGGGCFSRERLGYWLEGLVGRQSEPKDLQFAYTRMFVEREAVMGAFNFSDFRQNSNVSQHRVEVFYQAYKNVQLAFTGLIGRPLNWHVAPGTAPEPWLKRLQFDVIYKF